MKALPHAGNSTTAKQSAAMAMLCAALGYSCALACGVYPPERYGAIMGAFLAAPAVYVAFRIVAHHASAPDFDALLQHCSIALAIVLLPMLFAADSMPAWMQLAVNAGMLGCAGIAMLGTLSRQHSAARALVIMAACALGWIVGSRGLTFAGLGSVALHASTAAAIALLIASAPLFTRAQAASKEAEGREDARQKANATANSSEARSEAKNAAEASAIAASQEHAQSASETEPKSPIRDANAPSLQPQTAPDAPKAPAERLALEYELSKRESDLVALIVQGADNKRISEALFISPNTVKTHLRNIYGKLGVHSKEEIIALAKNR